MADASQSSPSRWLRASLATLLPAEILLLTLSFEPSRVETTHRWIATLLENSSVVLRIAIAMAGTLALLMSPRIAEFQDRFGRNSQMHPWRWAGLNLLCYAGLFLHTGWLFHGGSGGALDWQIAAWVLLCVAVGITWCLALAPEGTWRGFLVDERRSILVSLLAGIVVWVFGLLTQLFWRPLAEATLFFAHGILRAIYSDVQFDPLAGTVGTRRLLLEIAPQCSGYEGLALVTVFVAVYLWLFRERIAFPRALWLLPAGWLAIWIANVLRIAGLVVVGTSLSPQIATQGFHSQAGWIAFTVIALGLIWASHHASLGIRPEAAEGNRSPTLASALLMPLIAMLAASMVVAAFADGFDALYPIGVLATAGVLIHYRKSYRSLPLGLSAVSVGIGIAVFAAWIALERMLPAEGPPSAGLPLLAPSAAAAWIAFRILGSVVTVPIAEELAFRGYLLRKLVASDFERVPPTRFTWLSFVGSSLLFGLMHQNWFAGALAGAGFALAVYHRGRITDAIVAHMTTNALIAATVLGFGWWDLWF